MKDHLWLLPTVVSSVIGDELILYQTETRLALSPGGPELFEVVRQLDGNRTEEELRALPRGEEVLEILEGEKWLVRLETPLARFIEGRPWITRQLSFYAHLQRRYPDRIFAELASAHVVIVGTGGIGSHVAMSLAGAGVHRMTLMDPDTIDLSNLNRQFFYTREDVGSRKVDAAARFLLARHPHLQIDAIPEALFASEGQADLLRTANLILFAGDGPTVLQGMTARVGSTPVLVGGYMGQIGVVGPTFWPAKGSACWGCWTAANDEKPLGEIFSTAISREAAWNSSGVTLNGITGNLLAEEALRCLAPSLGGPLLLDARISLDMATLSLKRTPEAPVNCPHRQEVPKA
ncbi:HesA/MoeB/ThiF family protein [Hyalangium minutum]|uniref:Sulfur carrier protein adenylyltransferase ThiF n=1 Tax=Hyalangium minutum TaxID=394096 RepID=A0A085WMF8_9BACT|nr:ThiF family adenylyltransferase [Hyalangium minutum]KFE68871.1 Sulfur carrier protein adenylyltransferase ThiF [Hyalangium minutum]